MNTVAAPTSAASPALSPRLGAPPPKLPPHLTALLQQETPRFSAAEMKRRRDAFAAALAEAAPHLLALLQQEPRFSAAEMKRRPDAAILEMKDLGDDVFYGG